MDAHEPLMTSSMFLEGYCEVSLTLDSTGLSWAPVVSHVKKLETCYGIKSSSKSESRIGFSDVYAVECVDRGSFHVLIRKIGAPRPCCMTEMHRFVVHGFERSRTCRCTWVLSSYTFGNKDPQACRTWIEEINSRISIEMSRPKNLWVFVHPSSGRGNGWRTWQTVEPVFSRAKVKTKVTVTERAGHAFDLIVSVADEELSAFDGVVAVGGDGFFNEILNGLLFSRHKAPSPPVPVEFANYFGNDGEVERFRLNNDSKTRAYASDFNASVSQPEASFTNEDDPLLSTSESSGQAFSDFSTHQAILILGYGCSTYGRLSVKRQDLSSFFPNEWFRLGIIPSGSTDAIVVSTTGSRDPITSALHIVLGKRVRLDIAQVVRQDAGSSSFTRYAASFAGYGFYGDVMKESEKYRWMGPKRYDYAGTRVFLKHRSYDAAIAFLEDETLNSAAGTGFRNRGSQDTRISSEKTPRSKCCVDCAVCRESTRPATALVNGDSALRWSRSEGRYLSVGAAVISCRNGRAPDGLVADAHLADGFLHLILIKDCPRPRYLWHLTRLARKGADPLGFEFVEHHKTRAFTFTSSGEESVWNLDGELFPARRLSAQVFRGLVSLFAAGPE
ncbi:unnamed protein product [Spirodela intermedia]|uniref:DAGKc domain-containing protein n=1 Tax=Spirodela intermedia TaxID=51605 RepID=A0A7I8K7L3_SPIIN|nr:unnamed protein product [Spirodela intermedia]